MRIGSKVDQSVGLPEGSHVRGTVPLKGVNVARCLVAWNESTGPVRGTIPASLVIVGQHAELRLGLAIGAAGQLIDGGSNEKLEPD